MFEAKNNKTKFASPEDIQGISLVQEENLLTRERRRSKKIAKEGFLVHVISPEDLRETIKNRKNHIVLISKSGENITGYALSYNLETWKNLKPAWQQKVVASESINEKLDGEKILYLRHIARGRSQKGRGRGLMNFLIREATECGYKAIIAEILEKPIKNEVSLEFHKKFGFEKTGTINEKSREEELTWGLYMKTLNGPKK